MHTSLRLHSLVNLSVTSGTGTEIDVSSLVTPTYFVDLIPAGDVSLHPIGSSTITAHSASFFASGVKDHLNGPLRVIDGNYRLWASSTVTVALAIYEVSGEA